MDRALRMNALTLTRLFVEHSEREIFPLAFGVKIIVSHTSLDTD